MQPNNSQEDTMKGRRFFGTAVATAGMLALLAGLALAQTPAASPAGTAFTYQGRRAGYANRWPSEASVRVS